MTARAKRMITYLQDQFGWTVIENKYECSKDKYHNHGYGGANNFCKECGAKMKMIKDTDSVKQIEEAIKYALKEQA